MGLGILLSLSGCSHDYSILSPAAPGARSVMTVWWGMLIGFSAVMLAVVVLWLLAIRRPPTDLPAKVVRKHQRRWLLWGGLALPVSAMALVLAYGIPAGQRMLPLGTGNGDALRVNVTARQWQWDVYYPDSGIRLEDELHLPAGEAVDVYLTSVDVIHSFWVPRLGGKLDMLPGRTNVLRLEPDTPGRYRGQCAEFCGLGHAHMKFSVVVHSPDAFRAWQQQERMDD